MVIKPARTASPALGYSVVSMWSWPPSKVAELTIRKFLEVLIVVSVKSCYNSVSTKRKKTNIYRKNSK